MRQLPANILAMCQYVGRGDDGKGEEQKDLRSHMRLVAIAAIIRENEFYSSQ